MDSPSVKEKKKKKSKENGVDQAAFYNDKDIAMLLL